jgi:hypothetical protein
MGREGHGKPVYRRRSVPPFQPHPDRPFAVHNMQADTAQDARFAEQTVGFATKVTLTGGHIVKRYAV